MCPVMSCEDHARTHPRPDAVLIILAMDEEGRLPSGIRQVLPDGIQRQSNSAEGSQTETRAA